MLASPGSFLAPQPRPPRRPLIRDRVISFLFADGFEAAGAADTLTVIERPTTHTGLTQEELQVLADLIVATD